MDFQHTISVPTKLPGEGEGGGLNKMLRYSGSSSGDAARRPSSDSNGSIDVAASLFSSMRTLEASGRNLSSLRLGEESTAKGSLLLPGAVPNINGRVDGAPVGGLGTGSFGMGTAGHNNLRLPTVNPTSLMQMFPPPMGGSLPRRSLEIEAILRQQQNSGNPYQAPPLLDTIRGGYLPSSTLRGSIKNSSVNDFTTQELIHELSRRQSERCGASAVLNGMGPATSAMLSEQYSKPFLMNGLQPQGLLDSSHANVDLANLYRMKSTIRRDSGASLDSFDLPIASKTNPTQSSVADTLAVTSIPTCFKPSTKSAKKRRKDENVQLDVSDVSGDEAPQGERTKAKRTPSASSLDVLLTALGDDLEKLEKDVPSIVQRENEDKAHRRLSRESLLSNISDEQPPSDFICQPVTQTQNDLSRMIKQSHLATLLDCRSSLPMPSHPAESDAMLYPAPGPNFDYARRMQASNSMMASLESAMIRNDSAMRELVMRDFQARREYAFRMMQNKNDSAMREFVMRDFQARREYAFRMMQNNMQPNMGPPPPSLPVDPKPTQQPQLPGKLPSSDSRNVSTSDCEKPIDDKKENHEPTVEDKREKDEPHINHIKETPIKETAAPLKWKEGGEEPNKVPPKEALELFLSAYGEKGETLRDAMLKAISETESSLATIHSWDRSQGLRKCHSRTVVKTRRSRAQIKAFLTGVEAPKEPYQNRKRSKKSKSKNMVDVFGPPRDHWRAGVPIS